MKFVLNIVLLVLFQYSVAQDISVKIDLEKDTFVYLEDIFPQITIINNSDYYYLFSSYQLIQPTIYFELYDNNNEEVKLFRETKCYIGNPFYLALSPNRSVKFPLNGYYYFPHIAGGRHIKPGKYKVRGMFYSSNKKHFSNWFNFEIFNPIDTVLTKKYIEAEDLLFSKRCKDSCLAILQNLIDLDPPSIINLRAISLLSFHYEYRVSNKDSIREDIHNLIRRSEELFLNYFPDSRQALALISEPKFLLYDSYHPDSTRNQILNYTRELIPQVENREIRTKLKYRVYQNPPSSLIMLKVLESGFKK